MLTTRRYEYLNFDEIKVHPTLGNHRALSDAKVAHLEKDIVTNGLLEPLVVWERSSREYYLVGGFHRMEAIKGIRIKNPGYFDRVDVRVVAGETDEIKALNLKLNADRLDTKVTDYFETVVYLNNANWSKARVAEFLDKSESWIDEIIKFAPMVTPVMRKKLDSGELSWNRAKEILQRTIKAPLGKEKDTIEEELSKSQARVIKPLSFRSVVGHFSKMAETAPKKILTVTVQDLCSLIVALQGKNYGDDDLKRVRHAFPELLKG